MGLLSNWLNRKKVEEKGKEVRQIVDSVVAILLPRVNASINESVNPDFANAISDYEDISDMPDQPINIMVRVYDYQASATENPDLLNVKKKAYTPYPYINQNDILLIDNQEFTVLLVNKTEGNGEVVMYLK